MKIVNFQEFLELPEYTVYLKYYKHVFGPISIKYLTIDDNDFRYSELVDFDYSSTEDCLKAFDLAISQKTELKLSCDETQRDSTFDENQLFIIFNKDDIIKVINKLNICLFEKGNI